jgi:CRISPR-associated protein (TIGR02584 family)
MKTKHKPPPVGESGSTDTDTVLVAFTGMSPAVLSETVWALAFPAGEATQAIIPARVIALATSVGRQPITQQLFAADAIWQRLREAVLGRASKPDPRVCFRLKPYASPAINPLFYLLSSILIH